VANPADRSADCEEREGSAQRKSQDARYRRQREVERWPLAQYSRGRFG
jgi:hypothetical protein